MACVRVPQAPAAVNQELREAGSAPTSPFMEWTGMDQARLSIEGMSCGHCVAQVRRTLEALPGVTAGEVKIGSAELTFDPATTPLERVTGALEEEGYPARIAEAG